MPVPAITITIPEGAIASRVVKAFTEPGTNPEAAEAQTLAKQHIGKLIARRTLEIEELRLAASAAAEPTGIE
jgi:hypothetical protein